MKRDLPLDVPSGVPLYNLVAQGRFMTYLGRTAFSYVQAAALAYDLRMRGYADAHAQLEGLDLGPLALTLVVRGKPWCHDCGGARAARGPR